MFQCKTCPNRPNFSFIPLLKEHIAVHHFYFTPYLCDQCSAHFGTEEAIVEHYRSTHGMQQFIFKFQYHPRAFQIRDKINCQAQDAAAEAVGRRCIRKDSISPPLTPQQTSIDRDALVIVEEPEIVAGISGKETDQPSSSKTTAPPVKIGNVDISEFGEGSIVRDKEFLAAIMKKTQESNNLDDSKKRVACVKCGTLVADQRSSRFYHANTKHIQLPLYECKGCSKKWCTISRADVVKHVVNCHKGDESLIIDHKPRVRNQLRVFVELCFPKKENPPNDDNNLTLNSEDGEIDEEEEEAPNQLQQGNRIKEEVEEYEEGEVEQPAVKKRRTGSRIVKIKQDA